VKGHGVLYMGGEENSREQVLCASCLERQCVDRIGRWTPFAIVYIGSGESHVVSRGLSPTSTP
jgi:hypothetical protein